MDKDAPNFSAWSLVNLKDFATEAYIRLQHQDEMIQDLRLDQKMLVETLRKLIVENNK